MIKNKTLIFILRLLGTIVASLVVPFCYMTIRFNLFQATSKVQFGFWGVVLLIIMAATVGMLIKFYLDGMKTKYSYMKQILSGTIKIIIPMLIAIFVLRWLGDNIDYVIEVLCVLVPCEAVAICLNPLPKWAFNNNVDGIGEITDFILSRRDRKKKNEETSNSSN